jgi:eukaryotic-like serine/threonine-protein kinase
MRNVLEGDFDPPSKHAPDIAPALEAVTLRGLDRDPAARFATARDMALAIEAAVSPVAASTVGAWVDSVAHAELAERSRLIEIVEVDSASGRGPRRGPRANAIVNETISGVRTVTEPDVHTDTSVVSSSDAVVGAGKRRSPIVVGAIVAGVFALFVTVGIVETRHGTETPSATPAPSASVATVDSSEAPSASSASSVASMTSDGTTSASVPSSPPTASGRHRWLPTRPPPKPGAPKRYVFDHL